MSETRSDCPHDAVAWDAQHWSGPCWRCCRCGAVMGYGETWPIYKTPTSTNTQIVVEQWIHDGLGRMVRVR